MPSQPVLHVTHAHTNTFNGLLSGTTQVSWYQKGKTNLDFTEARDSEQQWHQLGHMQVCTSLQADNHASTPPLSFLQARCPSCHPTNSVKAQKEHEHTHTHTHPFNGPFSRTTRVGLKEHEEDCYLQSARHDVVVLCAVVR